MKTWGTIKTLGILTIVAAALSGCATAQKQPLTADVGYVKLSDLPKGTNQINQIRLKAIRDTATTLGATGALAWRSRQIDQSLKQQASYLDQVFNFNQLIINGNVLPPVIVESDNSLNLANSDTVRFASKIYKIIKPARFVTSAPNWRSYLWMNYQKPTLPDHTLLPNTQAEANVWNSYLQQGWKQGLSQANQIFAANLNRLKRDYTGMLLYNKLENQRMVSSPYVAKANLGVTGDGKQIRIGDRVMRITKHSSLQVNSKKWRPVITK